MGSCSYMYPYALVDYDCSANAPICLLSHQGTVENTVQSLAGGKKAGSSPRPPSPQVHNISVGFLSCGGGSTFLYTQLIWFPPPFHTAVLSSCLRTTLLSSCRPPCSPPAVPSSSPHYPPLHTTLLSSSSCCSLLLFTLPSSPPVSPLALPSFYPPVSPHCLDTALLSSCLSTLPSSPLALPSSYPPVSPHCLHTALRILSSPHRPPTTSSVSYLIAALTSQAGTNQITLNLLVCSVYLP